MTSTLAQAARPGISAHAATPIAGLVGVGVTYTAGKAETHALSGVDLQIMRGEYVAVTGPSGCGKTTLLSILGLLDDPTTGEYLLNGTATRSLSVRERARLRNTEVGFVFQSFNLIEELTALENVALPLTYRAGISSDERRSRAARALEAVGLSDRESHLPSELSGGQQQRVAIARAMAGDPPLLLADEPTGNLDTRAGRQVRQLLSDLHEHGITVVLVSHDDAHVQDATRVVRLLDGKVMEDTGARRASASVA